VNYRARRCRRLFRRSRSVNCNSPGLLPVAAIAQDFRLIHRSFGASKSTDLWISFRPAGQSRSMQLSCRNVLVLMNIERTFVCGGGRCNGAFKVPILGLRVIFGERIIRVPSVGLFWPQQLATEVEGPIGYLSVVRFRRGLFRRDSLKSTVALPRGLEDIQSRYRCRRLFFVRRCSRKSSRQRRRDASQLKAVHGSRRIAPAGGVMPLGKIRQRIKTFRQSPISGGPIRFSPHLDPITKSNRHE